MLPFYNYTLNLERRRQQWYNWKRIKASRYERQKMQMMPNVAGVVGTGANGIVI